MSRKMKKWAAVALAAACVLLAAGCGNDEKEMGGGAKTSQSAGNSQGASGGSKGYVFQYNGTSVGVDADMAPILEALGKADKYYEAASCAFEGLDKTYTYKGFEIDTYPSDGKDCISTVVLRDDSVGTAEGVYIGDSLGKVKEKYGSGGTQENGALVYAKDGMKLCFILQGEEIISIEYRSTVLE